MEWSQSVVPRESGCENVSRGYCRPSTWSQVLTRTKMDHDELGLWKICGVINIIFSTPLDMPKHCIVCSKISGRSRSSFQSQFWCEGTRCSAGHRQDSQDEHEAENAHGVCLSCDQAFMLGVVKGEERCRVEGCNRTLRVDTEVVKKRLAQYHILEWVQYPLRMDLRKNYRRRKI